MTEQTISPLDKNLLTRSAALSGILFATVAICWLLSCPVAYHLKGSLGIQASFLAALICLPGAASSLMIGQFLQDPRCTFHRILTGIILRMGFSLLGTLTLIFTCETPLCIGVLCSLPIFYLACIAVDVFIAIGSRAHDVTTCPAVDNTALGNSASGT